MNFKKHLSNLWNNFLAALFPSDIKCIVCDNEIGETNKYSICEKCFNNLPFNDGKVCLKCGEKLSGLEDYCMNCKDNHDKSFLVARAPLLYDGVVRILIHGLKYNHNQYLGKYLGEFLVDEFVKYDLHADVVVPIPLNKERFKQREYNQAQLLCYPLCERLNLELDTTNFVRILNTPTQTELSKQERKTNLLDAFHVIDKSAFKDKVVLLVDDVYTTGATMEEASKTLLKSGAKSVIALSVAHTIPVFMRNFEDDEEN